MSDFWNEQATRGPESVLVGDVTVRKGSRVRLRPRAGGDVFDLALSDRLAVVDSNTNIVCPRSRTSSSGRSAHE